MKHIIIGTAGHIDHGKTTLIKALTGRSTDRLKEEKDRGISIELGFTYFDLPSGKRAGIIDVPGHERFVKNMLAGAMGMDIVLLVVAADEGAMPQTKEHLAILDLLGIDKGFIVLTKSDLVETEWIELVKEDILEQVKGTFLEGAPVVSVSSIDNTGIDDVIELIDTLTLEIADRETDDIPRLPVDRVFSMSGFGTIITGTLLSGSLEVGEEVQIYPKGKLARIRSLQVHDQDAETVFAGQRVAINMAGIKKKEIQRGDIIAPIDSMKSTMMLDVKVKLIGDLDRVISNRTRIRLYMGTKELLCRIVFLDRKELNPGEETYAQLRLEEPVVAKRGDRFIIRFYSPMFTIGGGEVLEANPRKKQPFDEKAIEELEIKEKGENIDIIERIILDKGRSFPNIKDISMATAMLERDVEVEVKELYGRNRIVAFNLTKDSFVIHMDYFNELKERIMEEAKTYHRKYPLREGIPKEEIRSKFLKNAQARVGEAFIDLLIEDGILKQRMENVAMKDFQIQYTAEQLEAKRDIIDMLKETRFAPPRKAELIEKLRYEPREMEEIMNSLINDKILIRIDDDILIHISIYEEGLRLLTEYIETNGYITIAQFRDILNTSRKIALSLLEYFDQMRITTRDGDKRILVK